jgi:hypothetical protein
MQHQRLVSIVAQLVHHLSLGHLMHPPIRRLEGPPRKLLGMRVGVVQAKHGPVVDNAACLQIPEQRHLRLVCVTIEKNKVDRRRAEFLGANGSAVTLDRDVIVRKPWNRIDIDRVDHTRWPDSSQEVSGAITTKAADLEHASQSHASDEGKQKQPLIVLDRPSDGLIVGLGQMRKVVGHHVQDPPPSSSQFACALRSPRAENDAIIASVYQALEQRHANSMRLGRPGFSAEVHRMNAAIRRTHMELTRWTAGDHRVNNVLRGIGSGVVMRHSASCRDTETWIENLD